MAGAVTKTVIAPLERIKIIHQTQVCISCLCILGICIQVYESVMSSYSLSFTIAGYGPP